MNDLPEYRTPYKVGLGIYLIKNVPAEHPIAIINDSSITWSGMNNNLRHRKTIMLNGMEATFDFYYGDVKFNVLREFSQASFYCYYHGYMGGENILEFDSECNISDNSSTTDAPQTEELQYVAVDDYVAIQFSNMDEILALRETPYEIGYMADSETFDRIMEIKPLLDGVRDVLQDILQFSHGHKYFGKDLIVRFKFEDMGNTPGAYPLAGAHIVNVARSIIDGDNNWPVECLVVVNENPVVWNELTTSQSYFNGFKVPMLFNVLMHELLHAICMGWSIYEELNVGWHDANLITQDERGWWYTGKEGSLAIKTYQDLTQNTEIDRIPIESDGHQGSIGHHFEEGFDNDGNKQIRRYMKNGNEIITPSLPYELMSTFSSEYEVLSMLTVGVLKDYGYRVNLESAYIGAYPNQSITFS